MADTTIVAVEEGESVASIAARRLQTVDGVWSLPENQGLRDRGRTPHILAPGDHLTLPAAKGLVFSLPTGKRHKIVIRIPKSKLKLRLLKQGQPRANQECVVTIDGKKTTKSTDGDGNLEVDISPLAQAASLSIGEGAEQITYDLKLRGLHPSQVVTGWQARLQNLGYPVGQVDGDAGRRSQAALCAFQEDNKIAAGPEVDTSTASQLEKVHGC